MEFSALTLCSQIIKSHYYKWYHRRTVVRPCVNGDVEIQWEWSNFDPSQKPNQLTDYDKTLHNWLRPRDEHAIDWAAYTIYSILGIIAAVYFPVIKHYIRYPKFSFDKVYTACVGNLLYRVSHKMIPSCCFVGKLHKVRNFDMQAADIRRTFWLSTNLDELT